MGKVIDFKTRKTLASSTTTDVSIPNKEEFNSQAAEEGAITAKFALEQVMEFADDIEDVLIMVRDHDGTVGFVTNLPGFDESVSFMENVKFRALMNAAQGEYNPGTGD